MFVESGKKTVRINQKVHFTFSITLALEERKKYITKAICFNKSQIIKCVKKPTIKLEIRQKKKRKY